MNPTPKATKTHTLRSDASGKFKNRQCGQCGSRKTTVHAEGTDKWCECSECGHSTDLGSQH